MCPHTRACPCLTKGNQICCSCWVRENKLCRDQESSWRKIPASRGCKYLYKVVLGRGRAGEVAGRDCRGGSDTDTDRFKEPAVRLVRWEGTRGC
jgi:hypothetical protein